MKLRALRLHNVRRFAGRGVAIENIGDGVNVLTAANEFGKSTCFEALHALFFQPHTGTPSGVQLLRPYAGTITQQALAVLLAVLSGLAELLLAIVLAFFLYRDGPAMAARVKAVMTRLGGATGLRMLQLAADVTRGVVWGLVGRHVGSAPDGVEDGFEVVCGLSGGCGCLVEEVGVACGGAQGAGPAELGEVGQSAFEGALHDRVRDVGELEQRRCLVADRRAREAHRCVVAARCCGVGVLEHLFEGEQSVAVFGGPGVDLLFEVVLDGFAEAAVVDGAGAL